MLRATCLPFRLISRRVWPALRWMNLGARTESHHRPQTAGQHLETDGFSCVKMSFAVCNVGHRIITAGKVGTNRSKREEPVMVATWKLEPVDSGEDIKDSSNLKRTVSGAKRISRRTSEGPWRRRRVENCPASLIRISDVKRTIYFVD